jgi:hypothetical protein
MKQKFCGQLLKVLKAEATIMTPLFTFATLVNATQLE